MTFKPFDLSGKVALISGGNGGIGLGMAEGIAQAGGDVCIWGTNPDKNAAAIEKLQSHGTKVAVKTCDVSDKSQVQAIFAETLAEFGRIDGCFANAGTGARGVPYHEMSDDDWEYILGVNLYGAHWLMQLAAKHFVERAEAGDPFGRLIATSSLAAISGQAKGQHYAATKGALVAMIKALAVEYARYNVTAHTILPGWIETGLTEATFANEKFTANVIPRVPMRRWGQPEDFAGIAIYIMSDASKYHTAETFLIDGGYFVY